MEFLLGAAIIGIVIGMIELSQYVLRTCPYCSSVLRSNSTYCRFCDIKWSSEEVD